MPDSSMHCQDRVKENEWTDVVFSSSFIIDFIFFLVLNNTIYQL